MTSAQNLINSDGMSLQPTPFLDPGALITLKISVGEGGLRCIDELTRLEKNFEMVLKSVSSEACEFSTDASKEVTKIIYHNIGIIIINSSTNKFF